MAAWPIARAQYPAFAHVPVLAQRGERFSQNHTCAKKGMDPRKIETAS